MLEFGKIEYVLDSNGEGRRKLKLTLIGHDDGDILSRRGLSELRRRRVLRLTEEARAQGSLLSYEDLAGLLLCSLSTLKRDIALLRAGGHEVPLKDRRKNNLRGGAG